MKTVVVQPDTTFLMPVVIITTNRWDRDIHAWNRRTMAWRKGRLR